MASRIPFAWIAGVTFIAVVLIVITISNTHPSSLPQGDYASVEVRRMPCGRLLRREVLHENDAWRKTVTLMSPEGEVLATKTRLIEPEQCNRIRAGQFVPGLWADCAVPM